MSNALADACNIADLRLLAQRRLPRAIFDFFDGGAEDETTLRGNRAAFERIRLLPRTLVNVETVDTRIDLFGVPAAAPIVIAPTGAVGAGRPGAEVFLARAAKAFGIPFTLATPATASIERVAAEAGGRLWFQLYVLRNKEFRDRLVKRADAAGYEALVVTVDLPVGGKRERDTRNGFTSPFRANWRNSRDMWRKLPWLLDLARHGMPKMENLEGLVSSSAKATDVASSVGRELDASFDWEGLARIRDQWPRRLIVKGVERADDAARIADLGCDGIVVSNHGGRHLDTTVTTAEVLAEVVAAAGRNAEIYVDGGIRRGTDILKALALGARAVLVGRPPLWGLSVNGADGVAMVLEHFREELVRAMQLTGTPALADATPDLVA